MAEWVVDRCGITHEIENRPILVLRACARHRQAGSSPPPRPGPPPARPGAGSRAASPRARHRCRLTTLYRF